MMDMWSDPNLTLYMAVTAHWIEAHDHMGTRGQMYKLNLCTDLIGFIHVPGQHTGIHLKSAFFHIMDRLNITSKVSSMPVFLLHQLIANKLGWATLDNASNNDTWGEAVEAELRNRKIPFSHTQRCIRSVRFCCLNLN